MMTETAIETIAQTVLDEKLVDIYKLVVYNDDVNTFDHVIETLIKTCNHTAEQAEQCTIIIHYSGKCVVKEGDYTTLKPICTAILDSGIQADIQ